VAKAAKAWASRSISGGHRGRRRTRALKEIGVTQTLGINPPGFAEESIAQAAARLKQPPSAHAAIVAMIFSYQ
jgi:hypothetical protein